MPNKPLTIKAPGKLMIAGEFAVLEPHHKLAVMAVDRFVYATIQSSGANELTLENFNLTSLSWEWNNKEISINIADDRIRFVQTAMSIAFLYLSECAITPGPFSLSVKSELDDESGKKYGLGSSAAVVTAVVTAILQKYLPAKPEAKLIFKLAAIAHVITQGNGSGADVAASTYGGILHYASFQADWLKREYKMAESLKALVDKKWTYLSIKPLQLPENAYIRIGWTGTPASTGKLVENILQLKAENPQQFQQFLTNSEIAVDNIFAGMELVDIPRLLTGVKQNRKALATVGRQANVPLETPMLETLCVLAEQYGGAGKQSGAGGGDCGIAFMPSEEQANALARAWGKAGIQSLDIHVCSTGAAVN